MFRYPEAPASSEGSAEIGPPPYYHRSDCNICRQQDGLKNLWLVPKKNEDPLRGVEYMAQQPPLTASLSEAEEMLGKIRAASEPSRGRPNARPES
jgi:hypothetical protein